MESFLLLALPGILIIASLIAMGIWMWKKRDRRETDYYMLFIVGVIWAASGIIMISFPLFALGSVFLLTGFTNKKKWKTQKKWKNMKKDEKILTFILLSLSMIIAAFAVFSSRIS